MSRLTCSLPSHLERLVLTFCDLADVEALYWVSHAHSQCVESWLAHTQRVTFGFSTRFGLQLMAKRCRSLTELNDSFVCQKVWCSADASQWLRHVILRNVESLRRIDLKMLFDEPILEAATHCSRLEAFRAPWCRGSHALALRLTRENVPHLRVLSLASFFESEHDTLNFLRQGVLSLFIF